ncbi:hypothetical protein Glove_202g76 [Diversispora epigaea]|uniref:SET domain-containing protein n=1 Tax=Diversispora epigaea TaxID=1348612 RepID=A0A397IJT8_9GLOM|nr:hypothetical protein Glove_202g76 [Diversispora epigaea]
MLALYLALEYQKGINSQIYHYIQMLPKDFDDYMPIYFDYKLLEIVPDNMKELIDSQKIKFEKDLIKVSGFLKSNNVTRERFLWGWICVTSRCIYLENSKSWLNSNIRDNIAIAPMLDFLNHSFDAKIKGEFNKSNQCYEITTFTSYKKGQQVFINYGPHDNYLILLDYGFTILNNLYNYISLDNEFFKFKIPTEDERIWKFKSKLLMENGFYGDYTLNKSQISFRLLSALRLRLLPEIVNMNNSSNNDNSMFLSPPISQSLITNWKLTLNGEREIINNENEVEIYRWIYNICMELKNKYELKLKNVDNFKEFEFEKSFNRLTNIKLLWIESIDILNSVIELCNEFLH